MKHSQAAERKICVPKTTVPSYLAKNRHFSLCKINGHCEIHYLVDFCKVIPSLLFNLSKCCLLPLPAGSCPCFSKEGSIPFHLYTTRVLCQYLAH